MSVQSERAREALAVVREYGPLSPTSLADLMGWGIGEAFRVLRILENEGYAERSGSRYDATGRAA